MTLWALCKINCAIVIAFVAFAVPSALANPSPYLEFEKVSNFLNKEPNLRKWDAPVMADLDQDGYIDLLLNDHGFSVKIIWNNNGTFAQPYDLIMGDMHGISADDFDSDGNIEVVIARGGGSGSNARNSVIYRVGKDRKIDQISDFDEPLAFMRGRTVKFVDIDNDGDSDLINFAFPSQDKRNESENYLYENNGNGSLVLNSMLPQTFKNGQKVLISDFNSDGQADLFLYGHDHLRVYQGGKEFTFNEVTQAIVPSKLTDISAIVELDFDNDGDFDLFIARGQEFERGQTFYNEDTLTFGFFTKRGTFDFLLTDVGDVLNIENMQSQWPHKNLYIGESGYDYAFPGETHSGRDVRLVNSDALGFAQTLDKKGAYIGYIGNKNWRLAGDIWAPFSGVIHGVSNIDVKPISEGLQNILLENQGGKFVDVSKKAGLKLNGFTMGAAAGDIDNDGLVDLLLMQRGNMVNVNPALLYINTGKNSFKLAHNHKILSPELGAIGLGVELFDYDLDGDLDAIIGNERGKWHLFNNQHTLTLDTANASIIRVARSPKTKGTPLGAVVQFKACSIAQTKRVGSTGAAYSLSLNTDLLFAFGDCNKQARVNITWSNNENETVILSKNSITIVGRKN